MLMCSFVALTSQSRKSPHGSRKAYAQDAQARAESQAKGDIGVASCRCRDSA
jgi:hypothetical protein